MDEVLTQKKIEENNPNKSKKKKGKKKYIIYIVLVLLATALALFLSLKDNAKGVIEAFSQGNYIYILAILGIVIFYYLIDALIILVFVKLYSRKYSFSNALSTSMVGAFYTGITPGASGGQVMQAYTLKKQGIQISNAASILVMYFILYNITFTIFSLIAVIFKFSLLQSIGSIPLAIGNWKMNISLVPLTIIAFVIHIAIIGALFLMSYSHHIHNFIMHYGVGLLARIKIIKHPDKTRETLRIQVENFKIELRRLQSNIPVTLLISILFFLAFMCRYSIPWFAGMALNGYGLKETSTGFIHTTGTTNFISVFDACFMSCYHESITGLIPIPGGAGISEILFSRLFENFYKTSAITSAAQITWRASTYHLILILTGIFTALYKPVSKEEHIEIDRKTFVTLQYTTFLERKKTSDDVFNNKVISRKELQSKIKEAITPKFIDKKKDNIIKKDDYHLDDSTLIESSPFDINDELLENTKKENKKHKYSKKDDEINWRDINVK